MFNHSCLVMVWLHFCVYQNPWAYETIHFGQFLKSLQIKNKGNWAKAMQKTQLCSLSYADVSTLLLHSGTRRSMRKQSFKLFQLMSETCSYCYFSTKANVHKSCMEQYLSKNLMLGCLHLLIAILKKWVLQTSRTKAIERALLKPASPYLWIFTIYEYLSYL